MHERRKSCSRETIGEEMTTTMAEESILSHPLDKSNSSSSEDTQASLSYIALIAKVLLSSPSQKLNLASIYRAMEEQFPHLRSRRPGWKNSVRHNLSVNECFVKVSRCEDGRGHYWGVHQAHLRDFQQGNFRLDRKARGRRRRRRESCDKAEGLVMETSCFLESRPFGCVEPRCPLQEPRRYQMSSLEWTRPGWVQHPSWMRCYYFLPDSYSCSWRGHASQPMTSRLCHWEMNDPVLGGINPQRPAGPGVTPTDFTVIQRL